MTNDSDMDAYSKAREDFILEEKARAFATQLTAASSNVEKQAAESEEDPTLDHTHSKPLNFTNLCLTPKAETIK